MSNRRLAAAADDGSDAVPPVNPPTTAEEQGSADRPLRPVARRRFATHKTERGRDAPVFDEDGRRRSRRTAALRGVMEDMMGLVGRKDDALDADDAERADAPSLLLIKYATKVMATPQAVWFGVAIGAGIGSVRVYQAFALVAIKAFANVTLAVSLVAMSLPLFSLRRVTRDDGQLKTLGVGTAQIPAKAAKRLGRWGAGLLTLAAFMELTGVINVPKWIEQLVAMEEPPDRLLLGLFSVYVFPLTICAWWLTLKEASALVSGDIMQTRKLIDKTSATSAEW